MIKTTLIFQGIRVIYKQVNNNKLIQMIFLINHYFTTKLLEKLEENNIFEYMK